MTFKPRLFFFFFPLEPELLPCCSSVSFCQIPTPWVCVCGDNDGGKGGQWKSRKNTSSLFYGFLVTWPMMTGDRRIRCPVSLSTLHSRPVVGRISFTFVAVLHERKLENLIMNDGLSTCKGWHTSSLSLLLVCHRVLLLMHLCRVLYIYI